MPQSCCVVGCRNRRYCKPGLTFHNFPVDPERRAKWIEVIGRGRPNWQPNVHARVCGDHFVSGRKSENPRTLDYTPSIFPVVVKTDTGTITLPAMRDHKTTGFERRSVRETSWTRADDVPVTPGQTVADPCESSKAPSTQVKKEDVIEVIIGETGERTNTTNVSESPETFTIEGRYGVGTWEQATVETIMSLRLLGTRVTTTQVAQTIIANLKDENDFLCEQNANLGAELKAMQWMHEQELRDLQERLEMLKQKCSCGAMSETTDTSSEAEHSDVMVAEIKTEPHDSGLDLQGNSIY
ncbi:THAP domain-containing protein 11-like isoform X2 [Alosa sapidissima]|uniref:THAP domain-containing protein 11-like isoform X2 n=1 Tax=Alosa sapidissima TaxID=34773 RepID=UPI001C09F783|nr:THAP domain-containing protein 11-like isoform X2 [Alosa sapidissima]